MPKVTRADESGAPKKRSRKAKTENGNGNGAVVTAPVTTLPELAQGPQLSLSLEEKIRVRAYELYLQRGGTSGSPEQDWFQAQQEVHGDQA